MKNQHTPPANTKLLHFMLRAQQIAIRTDRCQADKMRSDAGYAMVIVSILSIFMFSLLAAYLTMTNLSKSATNAFVDGNNAFYVAESGLNRRADKLRQKFNDTITPTAGSGSTPSNISSCFSVATTVTETDNDFECRSYGFQSNSSAATVQNTGSTQAWGGATQVTNNNQATNYVAYTYVKPTRDYAVTPPTLARIGSGEPYAGLNALEYQYNIYSTARINPSVPGGTNIVLQMGFKSRVVPLFQFAAFYEEDLEMDSQMPMSVGGPVHTNGNLRAISYGFARRGGTGQTPYTSPGGETSTTFNSNDLQFASTRLLGNVTVTGSIYERVPTSTSRPDFGSGWSCGNNAGGQTKNCGVMAVYTGSATDPSTDYNPANYIYFPDFGTGGRTAGASSTPLTTSELSTFGSKMLDGSGGVKRLNPPKPGFLRERNYKTGEVGTYYGKADMRLKFFPSRAMPFSFISIQSGGSGCSGLDIPSDRQGFSTRACTTLNKGQLWSLQQPVLKIETAPTAGSDDDKIFQALKIAIASSSLLITPSELKQALPVTPTAGWQTTLNNLLPSGVTWAGLITATPQSIEQILKSKGGTNSEILPPPIQVISGTSSATDDNTNNGGFYNQLQDAAGTAVGWMQMLQTNIKSLTYWNRDGIYVNASDNNLTTAYSTIAPTNLSAGLSTDNLVFIKSAADTGAVAGSFPLLGLAAADRTEGGLVLHVTVDDASGSITTSASPPTGTPSDSPQGEQVPGKDANGNAIAYVDKYRKYSGGNLRRSLYGFVFSGGEELPAPLTIATDQAAFVQGDYNNPGLTTAPLNRATLYRPDNTGNNNGARRQPAAIIADTITILSNSCTNENGRVGRVANKGTSPNWEATVCGTTTAIPSLAQVPNGVAVNAAFLGNIMKSTTTYNGGLNRHMRLLENWGGSTTGTYYNYTGSIVNLGEPLESGALAVGSGVPQRNFNFDNRFSSLSGLPPLTPSAVYLRQDGFKRSY